MEREFEGREKPSFKLNLANSIKVGGGGGGVASKFTQNSRSLESLMD